MQRDKTVKIAQEDDSEAAKFGIPDARQELSIELSDPGRKHRKCCAAYQQVPAQTRMRSNNVQAPAAMLAFSVLPSKGLPSLWTTSAGLFDCKR